MGSHTVLEDRLKMVPNTLRRMIFFNGGGDMASVKNGARPCVVVTQNLAKKRRTMKTLSSRSRLSTGRRLSALMALGFCLLLLPCGIFAQTPPANQPPVAVDDEAVTTKDTPVTIDVVNNDSDPDGVLNLASVANTSPANGTVLYNGDGTFTYTPAADFIGTDSFTYTIADSATPPLTSNTATVSIDVAVVVSVNIIPQKLNAKKMGVVPVVIFGSADLDVATIDLASIRLEGVAPIRSNLGVDELRLKFRAQEIVAVLGEVEDGDVVLLHLTGNLKEESGGGAIMGEDTVLMIKKGKTKPPKPPKPPKPGKK